MGAILAHAHIQASTKSNPSPEKKLVPPINTFESTPVDSDHPDTDEGDDELDAAERTLPKIRSSKSNA